MTTTKFAYAVIFILSSATLSFAQCNKQIPIIVDDIYCYVDSLNKDIRKVKKDYYYVVNIKDCRGELTYAKYNLKGCKLIEGQYVNGIDTLKKQVFLENEIGETKIKVLKYFEPIKNGEWIYYDRKGKITSREVWKNGILTY